jgi:hypothetical protein
MDFKLLIKKINFIKCILSQNYRFVVKNFLITIIHYNTKFGQAYQFK